jgi:hypothetical protein
MVRKVLGGVLVWVAMLAPFPGAGAGVTAVSSHRATYDFYLGGIWAGEMAVDAQFRADGYRAAITAHTSGIVGVFFTAGVAAETTGRVDADGLAPLRFVADAYERRHRQHVEITYEDGSAAAVRAEPAYRIRPWSIAPEDHGGFADPLSAAYEAFVPGAADAICDRTVNVFDGARRWAIEIGPLQDAGDRVRCEAVYVRIAGFKPNLMGERARRPFALFLERREDGLFHVVRATGQTSFGLAVLLLRE